MKTSVRKPSTKELQIVLAYWNRYGKGRHQPLVECRVLTDRIKRKVNGQLKYYTAIEICESIFNYVNILISDGHYWTYRWTIHDCLQRGLEKFMTEAEPYENFKCTYPVSKGKPKVENKEYGSV